MSMIVPKKYEKQYRKLIAACDAASKAQHAFETKIEKEIQDQFTAGIYRSAKDDCGRHYYVHARGVVRCKGGWINHKDEARISADVLIYRCTRAGDRRGGAQALDIAKFNEKFTLVEKDSKS